MNYIAAYQYTKTYAIELEIPKHGIRFIFKYLIVRKIGISCEVCVFFIRLILLPCVHPMNASHFEIDFIAFKTQLLVITKEILLFN